MYKTLNKNLNYACSLKIREENAIPWANSSFGIFNDNVINVKLKFKKEITPDLIKYNFHPTQQINRQKNGALVVTFTSSGIKSILWNIFKWGVNIEIISPKSFKEQYIKYLKMFRNLKNHKFSNRPF